MMAAVSAIPFVLVVSTAGSDPNPVTTTRSDPNPETLALAGVSPERLAGIGITLKAPPSDFVPKIGKRDIEASSVSGVSSLGFDLPIREIVLAQVSDKSKVPPMDRVLWVVSLDVSGARMPNLGPGGPGIPDYFPYLYSLVFVDPDTGVFVNAVEAACCAP
jgi:hypothetical protein